jgi:hypothetical protein
MNASDLSPSFSVDIRCLYCSKYLTFLNFSSAKCYSHKSSQPYAGIMVKNIKT